MYAMSIIDTGTNAIIGLLAPRASSKGKPLADRDPALESPLRQPRRIRWQCNQ